MSESPLTRRRFVASTLALAGLAVLGPAACGPSWDRRRAARSLAGFAGYAEAWGAVGQKYLAAYPEEKGLGSITEALVTDLGWQPWEPEAPRADEPPESTAGPGSTEGPEGTPVSLESRLHDRIAEEHRTAVTVQVESWILSRTEARIAALIALLGPESLAVPAGDS